MKCCCSKCTQDLKGKTALVTGASSGIGEAIALKLASMGIKTYAAARRVEKMEHLKAHGVHVVMLDITKEESIQACIERINSESGGVDILVNNAGYGSYGSIEEVPLVEAKKQFSVNLFGLAVLTQRVIPFMRKNCFGKIINITSIGGVVAYPYGGWYHSTKFALEGLSASLRQELKPFGIDVMVVRPGAIKSEWSGIAANSLKNISGQGAYAKAVEAMHTMLTGTDIEKLSGTPSDIAEVIEKAITSKHPKHAYIAPKHAKILVCLSRLIGDNCLRDALNRIFMKLPRKM